MLPQPSRTLSLLASPTSNACRELSLSLSISSSSFRSHEGTASEFRTSIEVSPPSAVSRFLRSWRAVILEFSGEVWLSRHSKGSFWYSKEGASKCSSFGTVLRSSLEAADSVCQSSKKLEFLSLLFFWVLHGELERSFFFFSPITSQFFSFCMVRRWLTNRQWLSAGFGVPPFLFSDSGVSLKVRSELP